MFLVTTKIMLNLGPLYTGKVKQYSIFILTGECKRMILFFSSGASFILTYLCLCRSMVCSSMGNRVEKQSPFLKKCHPPLRWFAVDGCLTMKPL